MQEREIINLEKLLHLAPLTSPHDKFTGRGQLPRPRYDYWHDLGY